MRIWLILMAVGLTAGQALAGVPSKVYVFDTNGSTASQRVLVAGLEGIVNKTSPEVYLGRPIWTQELVTQFPGTTLETHNDPAWFVNRYRSRLAGYVLYDDDTRNEATSVAGILSALMVDASTLHYATDVGLTQLLDVRGKDPAWVYANYGSQLSPDFLFSQYKPAPGQTHAYNDCHLRDFAIYKNGFMFSEPPAVETYYANQNDGTWAYGWAPSEYNFFSRASRNNLFAAPADWMMGASATCQWQVPIPRQPAHTRADTPTQPGVHYVAFVLSDGDNLQFLINTDYSAPWYGAPQRGSFTMNWDIDPLLREVNPLAMRYYYAHETTGVYKDFFVNAGGPGLIYPSQSPDIGTFVRVNSAAMAEADLNVISLLDDSPDWGKIDSILADPQVIGAMLKTGNAYKGLNGVIHWSFGKPCVAVKYSLWDGFDTAAGLVAKLNAAPHDPLNDPNSYSIVNVHPWSADPMANAAYIAQNVSSQVRVVTLEELMFHLRRNFGAPIGYGLRGEYYDNTNLTNLKLIRIDGNVNHNWGEGTPHPAVGAETFSVRWTGTVEPQYSETYTFYTASDDGARLWVNGQLVIDDWTDHGLTEHSGQIALTAGQKYDIRLEYYDNTVSAMVVLSWSSPSQAKQVIPATRLRPCWASGGLPAGWLSQDVGPTWYAGGARQASGAYTLTGGGWGIGSTADSFRYVYRPWDYDGEIIVRLSSLETFSPRAISGIMMRASLDGDAPFVLTAATGAGAVVSRWRTSSAAAATETSAGVQAQPVWLKLTRIKNTFSASASADGQTWTSLGVQTLAWPRNIYVGLAASNGNDCGLTRTNMDNVTVTAYVPGDFDRDGDVDQSDFGHMQSCFGSPVFSPLPADCLDADFNNDTDVDQGDLQVFIKCLTGTNKPGDPDCANS